jgi:hypothetical protein
MEMRDCADFRDNHIIRCMGLRELIKNIFANKHSSKDETPQDDIFFTKNFHAKAEECGLGEDHARLVYHEGTPIKGKEGMMVREYKGYEIGIYVPNLLREWLTHSSSIGGRCGTAEAAFHVALLGRSCQERSKIVMFWLNTE